MTFQFCPEQTATAMRREVAARMTDADRALAKLLASVEFFGEPAAAKQRPIPAWADFLAFNLRDPVNRAALIEALGRG